MKHTDQLTTTPMLADAFRWIEKIRFSTVHTRSLAQRISDKLTGCRALAISFGLIVLVGGMFLTGSYLFLSQLAAHGW